MEEGTVSLKTLQRLVQEGGLGVPDFELYFLEAQLQWLAKWMVGINEAEIGQMGAEPNKEALLIILLRKTPGKEREGLLLNMALRCWR